MSQIASLFASLTLQSAQFTSGLRAATAQSNAAATSIGSSMGRIASVSATALAGIGVAAVAGFGVAAKSAFDYASSLTELAQQTGTTVEQYQTLSLAAKGAGAEQATLDTALKKLNSTLGEAKNGSKAAVEAFKSIGIKPDQLASLERGGDLMPTIMEGLQNVGTAAEQAAAAKRIFGKAAGELLPLLTSGAEGYNAVAQEAMAMGLITEEQAARADEAADKMGVLGFAISTTLGGAIADTLPMIMQLVNWVAELIRGLGNGMRELQIFAYKAALVQNQFEVGVGATAAFLGANNPVQGYRDAQGVVQRGRQRRDRLQAGLKDAQTPQANGIWDASRGRFVTTAEQRAMRAGAPVLDLDAPNLRGGGGGGKIKPPKRGGGGGGIDPLKAAKDMVASLKFEAEQLERNEREQEIYNDLKRAGVSITSKFGAEIAKLSGELFDAKALKEYNKWLEETIENTKLAGRLIGLNDRDRLKEETIQEIMAKRPKDKKVGAGDNIVVTGRPKLTEEEQRLLDGKLGNFDKQKAFDDFAAAEKKQQEWREAAMQREIDFWEEKKQHAYELGEQVADIGQEMFEGLIFGTKSFEQAMTDALKSLGQMMLEELVFKPMRAMIVQGVAKLLMNLAGVPDLTGWGGGANIGSFSPGTAPGATGMAHGGAASAGRPYWVGEKGPELFTPGTNGTIIPNRKFANDNGLTINVDARGSSNPAEMKRVAHEAIMQAVPMITEASHMKTMKRVGRPRIHG